MLSKSSLLATLLLVSQALIPRAPYAHLLVPRQTVCDGDCAFFSSLVRTCSTTSCVCTAAARAGLQDCVNCSVRASPSSGVISAARDLISTFQSTCSAYGLRPVTIPAAQPTTPVVTPPPVVTTPRITTPRVITQVVTPPPVVVTTTPQVTTVTTTPVTHPPPSVSEDTQTISQTVIRPVVTTRVSVTPAVSGTSLPGLTGGISTTSKSGGVSTLVVALSVVLGMLVVI